MQIKQARVRQGRRRSILARAAVAACACIMAIAPYSAYADEADDAARLAAEQDILEYEDAYAQQLEQEAETSGAESAREARDRYVRELAAQAAYEARAEYAQELEWKESTRARLVNYALGWVGVTPYVWAGGSLRYGTDCSGFVSLIFREFGYYLPTGSDAYQYSVGWHVSSDELLPGDIIVYGYGAHVGIYAGNGYVVHCSSPSVGTVVYNMWYRTPTAFVRVIP